MWQSETVFRVTIYRSEHRSPAGTTLKRSEGVRKEGKDKIYQAVKENMSVRGAGK